MKEWNSREIGLINDIQHQHETNVANGPLETNSHPGSATGTLALKIAKEGARTIPGRPENGGNCDIKTFLVDPSAISQFMLTEQSFQLEICIFHKAMVRFPLRAIEMPGVITIKVSIIKGGIKNYP